MTDELSAWRTDAEVQKLRDDLISAAADSYAIVAEDCRGTPIATRKMDALLEAVAKAVSRSEERKVCTGCNGVGRVFNSHWRENGEEHFPQCPVCNGKSGAPSAAPDVLREEARQLHQILRAGGSFPLDRLTALCEFVARPASSAQTGEPATFDVRALAQAVVKFRVEQQGATQSACVRLSPSDIDALGELLGALTFFNAMGRLPHGAALALPPQGD